MSAVNKKCPELLLGAALISCFAAASSAWADDKPSTPAAATDAAPATDSAQTVADTQLQEETARLQKLQVELQAIESVPLPSAAPPAPTAKAKEEKADSAPIALPKEPVKGLEEEFANALYAVGKYDAAGAVYRQILESKPKADVQAWARFQIANCAKRAGDLPAAAAAYEEVLTFSPGCPWSRDATWWANELKWRMRWELTTR